MCFYFGILGGNGSNIAGELKQFVSGDMREHKISHEKILVEVVKQMVTSKSVVFLVGKEPLIHSNQLKLPTNCNDWQWFFLLMKLRKTQTFSMIQPFQSPHFRYWGSLCSAIIRQ